MGTHLELLSVVDLVENTFRRGLHMLARGT